MNSPQVDSDKPCILVIDDETNLLRLFEYQIRGLGYNVVSGTSLADLRQLISERPYNALLLDMMLPDGDGLEALPEIKQQFPDLPVILITAYGTIEKAVDAMLMQAFYFLSKPVNIDKLTMVVRNAVDQNELRRELKDLKRQLDPPTMFQEMVGGSEPMQAIYSMIESVAPTTATVMITGESGTGKELVARAVHYQSNRHKKPLVAINCAAIPRDLLESELFGHEKGAFTGATSQFPGCFERADGGTLFMDEICEMDLGLQSKLLRLIQEQTFYRIGGTQALKVDVRIVAATNQAPLKAIKEGRFREDLYYRLNVVPIQLPPLRERREDVAAIAQKFLLEFSMANNRDWEGFDLAALEAMENYNWPGNVRELRNVVEQLVVLRQGRRITLDMLPPHIMASQPAPEHAAPTAEVTHAASPESIRPFWQLERDQIQQALDLCRGNVQEVAGKLEISPATLYRKIEKYGLVK